LSATRAFLSGKPYLEIFLDTHRSLRLRCRDWSHNITAQNIGGYFYDKPSRTLPVFVNYNKDEDAIAYEDHFVSENHMVALSKTKRKVNSSDADHIFKRTEEDKPTRSTSWAKSTPRATRNRSRLTAVLMPLRSTTDCVCRFETTSTPISLRRDRFVSTYTCYPLLKGRKHNEDH
jgi:hypothetical protein